MAGMEFFSLVLATVFVWDLVRGKATTFKLDTLDWLCIGLSAATILSLITSELDVEWRRGLGLTKGLLIFVVLRRHFTRPEIQKRAGTFIWIALLAAGVVGLYGSFQYVYGWDFIRDRGLTSIHGKEFGPWSYATGFFNSSMTYGHSMTMPFLIGAALSLFSALNKERNWIGNFGMIGAALGLFAGYQRGPWVGAAVGLLFIFPFLPPRKRWQAIAACGLAAVVLMVAFPAVSYRVSTIFNMQYGSNSERIQLWKAHVEMFKDRPLTGVGFSQSHQILPQYYERLGIQNGYLGHAHNNFFDFLGGSGLLGAALYIGLVLFLLAKTLTAIRKGAPHLRSLNVGLFCAQIAFFVGGMTECNFKDGELTHQFFMWIALALSINAQCHNPHVESNLQKV